MNARGLKKEQAGGLKKEQGTICCVEKEEKVLNN